ncbi:MAG: PLP-dependent aminotransferase family protein [Rhodospirillales bacterium]|nr:PLP-dependent aminotransferase family protein [Rhodospirillales bacterium]
MTIWTPDLNEFSGPRYKRIASAIGEAVLQGTLSPGDRLPTHRDLAYNLQVTVGTVTRAYKEAERRGLLDGEVGRGTFVKQLETPESKFVISDINKSGVIDLGLNFPPPGNRGEAFRATLEQLAIEPNLPALLDYHAAAGIDRHRAAGAKFMSGSGYMPDPREILVTNGAQHGMAVALMSLCKAGDTVLTEELTYPVTKVLASQLGIKLHGIAMDGDGMVPQSLEAACQSTGAKVLYFNPSYHNPTGTYMPEARRREIAEIGVRYGLIIIDDDVFGMMNETPALPMSAIAPDNCCYLTSTKILAPGLRIGFLRVPSKLLPLFETSIRTTGWMASPIQAEIATRWINDGTANKITEWHRVETIKRRRLANQVLGPHGLKVSEKGAYHIWFHLPEPWHQEKFMVEAKSRGVNLIGADTFAIGRNRAPHAIRICLGCTHERDDVETGLNILADILSNTILANVAVV